MTKTSDFLTNSGITNPGHRLQLIVSPNTRSLISALKSACEAASYGEVVRRALMAYEQGFEPERDSDNNAAQSETYDILPSTRLQIILPQLSMDRLNRLKIELESRGTSSSYSEVIQNALKIYSQIYRDLGRLEWPAAFNRTRNCNGQSMHIPSKAHAAS